MVIKKNLFFTIIASFFSLLLEAQVTAPKLVLPSPEAYSFTKYGDVPVGLFTGTMNYSLPLMNIKSGKIELPISLDYATNGVKVDEVAGRTGIGWNLRSGGVITRNIIGKADDIIPLTAAPPADSNSWEFYVYMQSATNQNANTQPDEFTYSFMGNSGKFYFGYDGQIKQLNRNGFRITASSQLSEFKITTTDGTEYFFGQQNKDYTDSYSFFGENDPIQSYGQGGYSAWYLYKIKNTTGDSIMFRYTAVNYENTPIEYFSSITQTNTLSSNPLSGYISYIRSSNCAPNAEVVISNWSAIPCRNNVGVTTDFNVSRIYVVKLEQIIFKQGKLNFIYSDRDDLPGEKKLDKIILLNNENRIIKTVSLGYRTSESPSIYNIPALYSSAPFNGDKFRDYYASLNKRLFLEKVLFTGLDTSIVQSYKFEYNDINGLPSRLSFAQDKFGYFNGSTESTYTSSDVFMSMAFGAPLIGRKTDTNFIKKGVLSKIIYPTGGFTSIQYESNTIGAKSTIYDTVSIRLNNTSASGGTVLYSEYFTVKTPLSLTITPKWVSQPDPSAPFMDSIVMVSIEDSITGECLILPQCPIITTPSLPFIGYYDKLYFLTKKGPFRLKLQTFRSDIAVDVSFIHFDYDTIPYNKPTGGVRVASIENFSSDNVRVSQKKYRYNIPGKEWSSGTLINDFQDSRDFAYYKRSACSEPSGFLGANLVLSSSSSLGGFSNDYLSVNYEFVTELQDSIGYNGSVQTQFFVEGNRLPTTFSCYANDSANVHSPFLIPGTPYSNTGIRNGKEKEQLIFRYQNGKHFLQKQIQQFYSVDIRNFHVDSFFVIRKQNTREAYFPNYKYFGDYDINKYKRYSSWVHLDSVIEKEYDNFGGVSTKYTSFFYDNSEHFQQTKTLSKNSKGEVVVSEIKYPGDIGNTFPYNSMVTKNMIDIPIQRIQKVGNKQTSFQKTDYFDWFGGSLMLLPISIKVQGEINQAIEDRIIFHAYDSSGNVLSLTSPEGVKVSYIWGSESQNPIAEVRNAKQDEIAYCSFEKDGMGFWEFELSGQTNNQGSVIGQGAYQLSNGSISKNGLSASKRYIVRFWAKDGIVANVNGNNTITLISRAGWSLKEVVVSGSSSIVISGLGVIDELKLFPENAQMKSFVFDPLIGMVGQSDENDRIIYYEYDAMGRLKIIRDQDRNIIKTFQYNYQQ